MQKIKYAQLNARQKETYNFQKVSAILADYGYATIKLNDDWNGADFIAQYINGRDYLKIQLKSRLTFDKKYKDGEIFICFPYGDQWYLFDHDSTLAVFLAEFSEGMLMSKSWAEKGHYSWGTLSVKILELLKDSRL